MTMTLRNRQYTKNAFKVLDSRAKVDNKATQQLVLGVWFGAIWLILFRSPFGHHGYVGLILKFGAWFETDSSYFFDHGECILELETSIELLMKRLCLISNSQNG